MKKYVLALAGLAFTLGTTQAQEDYNKWTIELSGGVNKPVVQLGSGYYTSTPNLWTAEAGVRYMFNNKFGFRLAGAYDSFKNADKSLKFESKFWHVNLQAVANIGRALNFETWTKDLGILAHGGFGYGQLSGDGFKGSDNIAFLVAGLTPQLRISNRVTLFGDGSVYFNGKQQNTFDTFGKTDRRGFQGVKFTATIGLSIALGKHDKHADWAYDTDKSDELKERMAALEQNVAGLQEQVAGKQNQMNDANGNGVPDEIERYLSENYALKGKDGDNVNINSSDVAADLIRKGYLSAYFDFNSAQPQVSSTWASDFVSKYLKNNPSVSVKIVGYADEIGGTNYNQTLSLRRAEAVKKLLVDTGIDASRITTEGRGEDISVNKNSPAARQIARRATFELK